MSLLSSVAELTSALSRAASLIKDAPAEVKSLAAELQDLDSITSSLSTGLQNLLNESTSDVASARRIGELTATVSTPLRNCIALLHEMMDHSNDFVRCVEPGRINKSLARLNWAFFQRDKVKKIQSRLQAAKSTLSCALLAVSLSLASVYSSSRVITESEPRLRCQALPALDGSQAYSSSQMEVTSIVSRSFYDIQPMKIDSFETMSNVYPEQCAIEKQSHIVAPSAVVPLENRPRTYCYSLLFQEQVRKWRRIDIIACFEDQAYKLAVGRVQTSIRRSSYTYGIYDLPPNLLEAFRQTLSYVKAFGCLTSVSVDLTTDCHGQLTIGKKRILVEREGFEHSSILQDMRNIGCRRVVESQVTFKAQLSTNRFRVFENGRDCLERKVSFARTGMPGYTAIQDVVDEVKQRCALQHTDGVLKFFAIVLDDPRKHLTGYLYEDVKIALRNFIAFANKSRTILPWSVREQWIQQIVSTVAEIHNRGFIVRILDPVLLRVRTDGTLALDLGNSAVEVATSRDRLPPELDDSVTSRERSTSKASLNFRTDIYQLGYLIWLIAEHRASTNGYYCARAACTSWPSYQCMAGHALPQVLPSCSFGVPAYVDQVVKACRQTDPGCRPSARELLQMLPPSKGNRVSAVFTEVLTAFPSDHTQFALCNECGDYTNDVFYHCYICHCDDFDLCQACFGAGVRCWEPAHHELAKLKNGSRGRSYLA